MGWFEEMRAVALEAVELSDLVAMLPVTPPCRHLQPHRMRPLETRDDVVNYMIFRAAGWEDAGYCWGYVPAFLHEWFGCGPDQELFVRPEPAEPPATAGTGSPPP